MKIACISDIHGNAVALEAVLQDLKKIKADRIVVLGDLAFRGPEPKRAITMIKELNADVIKGNADEWVIRGIKKGEVPESSFDIMTIERNWCYEKLDEDDISYLNSLSSHIKINAGNRSIYGFHATPDNLFEIVHPNDSDETLSKKIISKANADVYVYGHIHKPYIRFINGKIIMNTGSVGLPFDGMAMASYGLIEIDSTGLQVQIRRVKYEVEKVIQLYEEQSYPNITALSKIILNGSQ